MNGAQRKPTLPIAPWDAPKFAPMDRTAEQPAPRVEPVPAQPHMRKLILSAFTGQVDETDLKYMARAILQMADEIFVLRARLDQVEQELRVKE